MQLILFGPPGSGKGTQAALIVERLGFMHISTGELLRAAINSHSPLGQRVKEIVRSGLLVSDEIVSQLVREAIRPRLLEGKSIIFDGYPRTLQQVGDLEKLFEDTQVTQIKALSLDVPGEVVVSRLSGRLQCRSCGSVYHLDHKPPKMPGVCDACGGMVSQRPDDNPTTIRERLRVYEEQTRPVLDAYEGKGRLIRVSGEGTTERIYARIACALECHCV